MKKQPDNNEEILPVMGMIIEIPKKVWNRYKYITIYSAIVSTILLYFQVKGGNA